MRPAPTTATTPPGTASGEITTDQAVSQLKCLCDEKGINVSVSRCRRLVLRHAKRRDRVTHEEFTALRDLIGYSDPTGETAAHNVDQERKVKPNA